MDRFFSFSLGDIAVVISILTLLWRMEKYITIHQLEHDILIEDYMQRKGLKHFPTRRPR